MKKTIHSRIVDILLLITLLVSGIFCTDTYKNPSFLHVSSEADAVSLQPLSSSLNTHFFYERNTLNLMENFVLTRQSSRTPISLKVFSLLLYTLLIVQTYQLLRSLRNSFLYADAYNNQYHQRTLLYIHQNDGKKSNF